MLKRKCPIETGGQARECDRDRLEKSYSVEKGTPQKWVCVLSITMLREQRGLRFRANLSVLQNHLKDLVKQCQAPRQSF